jgi:hypothetical protein
MENIIEVLMNETALLSIYPNIIKNINDKNILLVKILSSSVLIGRYSYLLVTKNQTHYKRNLIVSILVVIINLVWAIYTYSKNKKNSPLKCTQPEKLKLKRKQYTNEYTLSKPTSEYDIKMYNL